MARIKYYDASSASWKYADTMSSVEIPTKLPNPHALTFTGAVETTYDGSEPVSVEIPQGGGSSEMHEIFRLVTTEEVATIETGIDLSKYSEVVAMCVTKPIDGTASNTHFDWYLSKAVASRINGSLHVSQKRLHVAHITRLSSSKAIARIGHGTTQGSILTESNTISVGSASNAGEIDAGGYMRVVNDNLNDNFKFGSYNANTPLIVGTEAIVYGRE